MKVTAAAKVGFTAIVVVVVLMGIFNTLGWRIPGLSGPRYQTNELEVRFSSVKGLNPGADVQLNGNPIGEVGEITNDPFGGVVVSLLIKKDQPIHEHARFTISRESIFGSYLVSIAEPRSGYLAPDIRTESSDEVYVRITRDTVEPGNLVIKDRTAIGEIVSVTPDVVGGYDLALIRLVTDVTLDATMAFVPSRPPGSGAGELIVYEVIAAGSKLDGVREPGPEDLVADADLALIQITGQAGAIMDQLAELLDNIEELVAPEDIRGLLNSLASDASEIADNIIVLTNRLNSMLAEADPHITGTFENIEGLTSEARVLLQDFSEYNDPELRENLRQLVANLADASERLNDILEDVEGYTSDEELREDITGTFSEARSRLEEARETLESVNAIIEEASGRVGAAGGLDASGEFALRYTPDPDHWAGDLNVRVGWESSDFFAVAGIDDIGENDRANAQIGWWFSDDTAARAGVHRGKLGLGLDWQSEAVRFVGDMYDPNDLTWDVYAGYAILPELEIIVGVEDLLEEDNLNFGLAFRF